MPGTEETEKTIERLLCAKSIRKCWREIQHDVETASSCVRCGEGRGEPAGLSGYYPKARKCAEMPFHNGRCTVWVLIIKFRRAKVTHSICWSSFSHFQRSSTRNCGSVSTTLRRLLLRNWQQQFQRYETTLLCIKMHASTGFAAGRCVSRDNLCGSHCRIYLNLITPCFSF